MVEEQLKLPDPKKDMRIVSDGVRKVFEDVGGIFRSVSGSIPEIPQAGVPEVFSALPKMPEAPVPRKGESVRYCGECLSKHSGTAKVLLREAVQRAEADGVSNEGVQEKVRDVVAEFGGAEYDSSSVANERIRALDQRMRTLRRKIQNTGLEVGRGSMEDLRMVASEVDAFRNAVYESLKEEAMYGCEDLSGDEKVKCIEAVKEFAEGRK